MPQVSDIIDVKSRSGTRKGNARKLRAAGSVPGVVYGASTEPRFVSIDPKTFGLQRAQYGSSHLYDVVVDGGAPFKALVREVQQNPITSEFLHVDLYVIDMSKALRVDVLVELVGKPAGAVHGGILQQVAHRVEVECLPDKIPERISADVAHLEVGSSLHLSDIKLPEGVKFTAREDEAVATVVAPQEEAAPAPAEAAAAATAAPAAPAAETEEKK